jgi:hypothetical protein
VSATGGPELATPCGSVLNESAIDAFESTLETSGIGEVDGERELHISTPARTNTPTAAAPRIPRTG